MAGRGLTENEKRVLQSLADAWNVFVGLGKQHPDDIDEFRRAIHAAEQLVAVRVARRIDPAIWFQPDERRDEETHCGG